MTPAEQFRYGFLKRCAEEGLSVEEIDQRAATFLKSGLLGDVGNLALAAGLAIPATAAFVGYQGGRSLGRVDNDYMAGEALQAEEKIDLYKRLAEKLRRERAMATRPVRKVV